MIITFFGHSEIYENKNAISNGISSVLNTEIKDYPVNFYLGAYGEFDRRAFVVCKQYKLTHNNVAAYFVTPYLDDKYLALRSINIQQYDGTVYPPLEKFPKKYAIIERNKWMINQADLVIAYVDHSWGGAAKALNYAHKLKKRYVNWESILRNFITVKAPPQKLPLPTLRERYISKGNM